MYGDIYGKMIMEQVVHHRVHFILNGVDLECCGSICSNTYLKTSLIAGNSLVDNQQPSPIREGSTTIESIDKKKDLIE